MIEFPTNRIARVALPLVLSLTAGCALIPESTDTGHAPAGVVLIAAAQGEVRSDAGAQIGSPYGSYLAGLFAGRQHDLASAADFMLDALAFDPNNPRLLGRALMLLAGDGRHEAAVDVARRVRALDPGNGLAGLVLAVDAVSRDAYDEAGSLLESLPKRGLSTVARPLLRAWLQLARGDVDGAIERIDPLQKTNGFRVLYHLHAGLIDDVAGRAEPARAHLDEALKQAGQPSLRMVWLIGNFLERTGARERAIEIYRDYLARGVGSTVIAAALARAEAGGAAAPTVSDARAGMAEALFNLASLLSQERAEEIALVHANLALRLRPDFIVAQVLIGEVLQAQGRGDEAIEMYRRIPRESPFAWMVGLRIAEELERLDRVEAAVGELERLAEAKPDRYEPLYRLGNLLRNKERFAAAVDAYDRAVKRVAVPERRHWSLFYFRGIALERLSDWDRAEKDFLKALDLEPEQPFVMNYLAYTWVEKKMNLDKAKGMLARAVELRPDDGFIVDSLGWVHYRLGEYRDGVKYLERAVELRSQDPVINDHLGDAYWRVGRHQEARFQWRRALSLDPEDDVAAEIRIKIERGLGKAPDAI